MLYVIIKDHSEHVEGIYKGVKAFENFKQLKEYQKNNYWYSIKRISKENYTKKGGRENER